MNICLTWWSGASTLYIFFFLLYYSCSASTITHFPLLSSQLIPQHWTALMNYLTLFPPFSSDNRALWKFQGTSADKQKYQYLNKLHIFKLSLAFLLNLSHPVERGRRVKLFSFFSPSFFFKALSPGALKEEFRMKRFIMRAALSDIWRRRQSRPDEVYFLPTTKTRASVFYPSTPVLCLPLKERKTA